LTQQVVAANDAARTELGVGELGGQLLELGPAPVLVPRGER
jgi:hypothetical protein